ncbi:MAG: hypothetical protein JWQ89_2715 [Devosia sp.]|uniref:hypothetical protein n=1 Tax=Devosia sp. TaxID=1871048 RepID=UPI00262CDDA7|nr:hypothetical protein [Devosia sp.]MDB5540988.1 hypothetical protein [Devosia sp.]
MSDKSEAERLERALETIDQSKRDAMRKLITTAAFAVPVVASFAIDGLVVSPALAANSIGS